MKYNVIQCADGNMIIASTWIDDANAARKARASTVNDLYADPGTTKAVVGIFDEKFNLLDDYIEYIDKTAQYPPIYIVSFNLHGSPSGINAQHIKEGQTVIQPADPEREGYDFIGWELNGYEYDFNSPVTKDIVLVATWEKAEAQPEDPTPSEPQPEE